MSASGRGKEEEENNNNNNIVIITTTMGKETPSLSPSSSCQRSEHQPQYINIVYHQIVTQRFFVGHSQKGSAGSRITYFAGHIVFINDWFLNEHV